MSSLMFQEIREFRSFAYRTSGRYQLPNHAHKGTAGSFYGDAVHSERQDAGCAERTGFADPRNAVEAGKGGRRSSRRW